MTAYSIIETPRRAADSASLGASSVKAKRAPDWKPVHDSLEEIISNA